MKEFPLSLPKNATEWAEVRSAFNDLQQAISRMISTQSQAGQVTNFRATAQSGSVLVEFTRSDADQYILYVGGSPNFNLALPVDLGNSNRWTDQVGAGNVQRFYWIRSRKTGASFSMPVGYVMATTLALNTPTTLPAPVVGSATPTLSNETGDVVDGRPAVKYQQL